MRIVWAILCAFILWTGEARAETSLYLNAFGETAAAYVNEAYLLIGTVADGYTADITGKETALEMARTLHKRIRLVRGKVKAVSTTRVADVDARLLKLLDNTYGCLDHQASALIRFIEEKSPDTARKFEAQRTDCLDRLKKLADFYSALPPSPEAAEPLITR
jgi:hypothetical protein